MEEFEPIDVEFLINSQEVKTEAAKVRKEIEGVGETAETVEKKVHQTVRRVATEQDKVLTNLRGQVKTTTRDAMEAFEQLDPAMRRNISQLVRYEAQFKKLRAAEKELQSDFKNGLITQGQYNKALEGIRAESQRTVQAMRELSKEVQNAGKEVQNKELSFVRMDKGVSRVNKNLMAFTYSSAQGFSGLLNNLPSLVDEISRMDNATKQLNAQGQKTPGVMKQIISSVFSWHTLIMAGISLIIAYREEIWEWTKSLFSGGESAKRAKVELEAFQKALSSSDYSNAVKSMAELSANIDAAREGLVSKDDVLRQFNERMGDVTGELKTWAELEQWQVQNADKYLEYMSLKARANAMLQMSIEKTIEAEKRAAEGPSFWDKAKAFWQYNYGTINAGATMIHSENVAALKKESDDYLKIFNDFQKEVQEFAKSSGFNFFPKPDKKTGQDVIKTKKDLLEKIAALDAEYARKSLTKDEEEVQALRDKFAKVRELVTAWNNDPKNKANRIDLAGLDEIEGRATGDLLYRQETARLKTSLEEQKRLYSEFDKTVADFGIQEAERRYQGQLDISRDYMDVIREEYDKLANMSPDDMSGGQRERLGFLSEMLRKEEDEQRKQTDSLLKTLQDYNTKRELMIEQHLLRVEDLRKGGNVSYVAEEERRHQEEINALDVAQIKKLEIYERFFQGVDNMSTKNAKKLIEDVRNSLKELRVQFPNLTKFFDEVEQKLAKSEQTIGQRLPRDMMELSQGFRRLSQEIGGANQRLGQMLGILSDSLARVADIKRGMSDFSAARQAGDGFGAVTAAAGVAGAVVGGIVSLASMMKAANEKQTDILKQQLEFQRRIYFGELEINRLVRERAVEQAKIEGNTLASLKAQRDVLKENIEGITADQNRINDLFNSATQDQIDDLNRYYGWHKTYRDKKLAELAQALYIEDTKEVRGGLFGLGKETINIYKSLAGLSFDEIENRSLEGRLTEDAEKLFQELKKLKEEGIEVENQLKEIENQMKAILTGGATAEGIADSIIDGFRQGKRAVEDFADDVEELLRRAILSGFKYRFLEAPLNELLNQLFADAQSDDGLSGDEIERFTQAYNEITQSALDALKQLEGVTGMTLSDPMGGQQRGLAGAIRREMTEATASELAGLWRGQYDITKRTLIVSEKSLEQEALAYEATVSIMQSNLKIEQNTRESAEALEKVYGELRTISKNTKPQQGIRDLGLG
jgi:hypothetical protein